MTGFLVVDEELHRRLEWSAGAVGMDGARLQI